MPACITSELRELVCVPIASSASAITTSRPAIARARAQARPMTPAPMTSASTLSMEKELLDEKGARAGKRHGGGQGPRAGFEGEPKPRAHGGADRELRPPHEGRGSARR